MNDILLTRHLTLHADPLLFCFTSFHLMKEDHSRELSLHYGGRLFTQEEADPLICITQVAGFRNVRQPPAVYRRGPTGSHKTSVSPSQTYPYHLFTDDCWSRCVCSQDVKTHQLQHYNACWLHRLDIKLLKPISTADAARSLVSKF